MAVSISAIVSTAGFTDFGLNYSTIVLCDSTANALSIRFEDPAVVRVFAKSGKHDVFKTHRVPTVRGHIEITQVAMSRLGVKVGDVVTLQKERNQTAVRIQVHSLAEGGWKQPEDILDDYILPYFYYDEEPESISLPMSKGYFVRKGDTFSCPSKKNPSTLQEFEVVDIEPGDYGFVYMFTKFELGPPIMREKKDVNPSEDTDPADSNTEIELGLPIGRERENVDPSEDTDPTDNGELVTQIRDLIKQIKSQQGEINDLKRRVALLEEDKKPNKSVTRSGVPTVPISSPAPVPVDDDDLF